MTVVYDRLLIPYYSKLEYPVKVRHRNPKLAKIVIEQYGGAYPIDYSNSGNAIPKVSLANSVNVL